MQKVLTLKECAELLRVSVKTVRRWIARRELVAIRAGGLKIDARELERFKERNRT